MGVDAEAPAAGYTAVIFDLDGVVTDTVRQHSDAWRAVFATALPLIAGANDVAPFTIDDYYAHIDGRSREDGVRTFLASRDLRLPEGRATDPPEAMTVHGLAAHQRQLIAAHIATHDVTAYPSTVALLQRLRAKGIATGLATADRDSRAVLASAGVDDAFTTVVDGTDAARSGLAGLPAPDLFCEAARRLGVAPSQAVVIVDAEPGIRAAVAGGFGRVIGVDRGGNRARLLAAGPDLVVADLAEVDVTAPVVAPKPWYGGAEVDTGPWLLVYTGYDPSNEGMRETLCTLGNGYWATRGAPPGATAGEVHYPGTYLAGVYNRVDSEVAGTPVQYESIVNAPNWLPLTLAHADGTPIDADHGTVEDYRQELDLRCGVLTRTFIHRDPAGRATRVTERRLVSMDECHLAALEKTIESLNWSGTVRVRSWLDGDVTNTGVPEYRHLTARHLQPAAEVQAQAGAEADTVISLLEVATTQARVNIALAARTRCYSERELPGLRPRTIGDGRLTVGHEFEVALSVGCPVTIEKIAAVATSRDRAISSPTESARFYLREAADFATLLTAHERAWEALWDDFAMPVTAGAQVDLALHLHTFHVLQTVAGISHDLDAGIGARGLHGEGYLGHVFWDEMFVYPMLTLRRPKLTRDLLAYRYRRLPAARAAAAAAGLPGAMFPWQSGNAGVEVTPVYTLNPLTGQWLADTSHRQRHVGLAIAYSVIQYFEATADVGFLTEMGGELVVEICRFFAAMPSYDPADDRYHIDSTMGPDEFHDGYPGHPGGGVRDNAYTNVMTAWLLHRASDLLEVIDAEDCGRLRQRLQITPAEVVRWEMLSRRLAVPINRDGVISQFEGYESLPELDWEAYRARYPNIERIDLILNAEGDSANNYRVGKQADVLMLFYLLSAEELRAVFERLGYSLPGETIRSTVDFYTARVSHGSTLSRVVHAWVNARADRNRAWSLFTDALEADLAERPGASTREGVHLGAMAGTVDLVLRCFAGLETRDDALWLHPVLPPELTRAEFTVVYRGQPVQVELTPRLIRVRLRPCGARSISVCVEGDRRVLHPGDVYEAELRPLDHAVSRVARLQRSAK